MIIYLPGFSLKNQAEAGAICDALVKAGYEVYQHMWRHWSDEKIAWDPETEKEIILSEVKKRMPNEISIVAKSLGTYIAVSLLPELTLKELILLGIPFNDLDDSERKVYRILQTATYPITIVHNSKDPHGAVEDIRSVLDGVNYQELIKDSDTHEYRYPDDVVRCLLKSWNIRANCFDGIIHG